MSIGDTIDEEEESQESRHSEFRIHLDMEGEEEEDEETGDFEGPNSEYVEE